MVADPGGVYPDPDSTFEKKPDPEQTLEKIPGFGSIPNFYLFSSFNITDKSVLYNNFGQHQNKIV